MVMVTEGKFGTQGQSQGLMPEIGIFDDHGIVSLEKKNLFKDNIILTTGKGVQDTRVGSKP